MNKDDMDFEKLYNLILEAEISMVNFKSLCNSEAIEQVNTVETELLRLRYKLQFLEEKSKSSSRS